MQVQRMVRAGSIDDAPVDVLARAIREALRMWPGTAVEREDLAAPWRPNRVVIHRGPLGDHEDAVAPAPLGVGAGLHDEGSVQSVRESRALTNAPSGNRS